MGGETHIGVGKIKLLTAINDYNTPCSFMVDLVHQGKKGLLKKGHMFGTGMIIATTKQIIRMMRQKEESFVNLHLNNIRVEDLFDTGSKFDPQDPSVVFRIGTNVFRTKRKKDAGTNAEFSEFFNVELPFEEYKDNLKVNKIVNLIFHFDK